MTMAKKSDAQDPAKTDPRHWTHFENPHDEVYQDLTNVTTSYPKQGA
jgi:hypothetical protein